MSNWSSNFVNTNGIRIHYYRTGSQPNVGDRPPLILAHGITDDGLCWTQLAQVLEQEYDVIMVDARGHGRSDAPETGYDTGEHAADLAGLIEALALEKPAVIGHSMGAANAAVLAAEYPNLVSCLVLEDPPWRLEVTQSPQERHAGAETWRKDVVKNRSKTREDLLAGIQEQHPEWGDVEFGPWADSKLRVNPNVIDIVRSERSWQTGIPEILCPTLLVIADTDMGAIVTLEDAKQIAAMNASIQVTHISKAGHSIRREQFQDYVEAVKKFLTNSSEA